MIAKRKISAFTLNYSCLPALSLVIMLYYGYSPLKKQTHRFYVIPENGSLLRDVIPRCTFHFLCWRTRSHFFMVSIIGLTIMYRPQLEGGQISVYDSQATA
jgi:hypothetical protein